MEYTLSRASSLNRNNRSNRMELRPAVLSVNDVSPGSRNFMADEGRGKNVLAEAIANAFFERIALRNVMAAHWLQDQITLLLFQVCLIQ